MPPRRQWILGAIWLIFLLRGAFYCRFIPLWEGFDEWGHYAFIEHLRLHNGSLPRTSDAVTEEIRQSVESAAFKHEAAQPLTLFEAQQPPLYYWILSIPNRLLISPPIETRVRILRMLSILLASLVIPTAYLAAIELFHRRSIALSVCALIASMPGLMIDIARIGNESLSIAIASWMVLLLLRKKTPALGIALGLGLLTKAYFLIFIPVLIFRRRIYSIAVALALGGWWYWRNLRLTGSFTGESMEVATARLGFAAKLAAFGKVHWLSVIDAALWTHIWTGGWSFFTVKSWMYRVIEAVFAVCVVTIVYALAKRPWGRMKSRMSMLVSIEVLFAAGISYQTVSIFLAKNISFAPGWYFYALIVPEALLLASGALILTGRQRVLLAMGLLTALFVALELYSVIFVLARHY